jgi:predicted ester cyclase
MTTEQNKAFVRQHFEDFVNNRNSTVIHQNMTPDFVDHDGPGGRQADAATDQKMMEAMYASMPDLRVTIEDMVAEGDKVVCRNVWTWKDAATGEPMEFRGFVEWRLVAGKIAERWAAVTAPRERA